MSACVEAGQGLTKDAKASDDFQWSLAMVSRSLTRTIIKGSAIVMKATVPVDGLRKEMQVPCLTFAASSGIEQTNEMQSGT